MPCTGLQPSRQPSNPFSTYRGIVRVGQHCGALSGLHGMNLLLETVNCMTQPQRGEPERVADETSS